jgi:hypothetical protein
MARWAMRSMGRLRAEGAMINLAAGAVLCAREWRRERGVGGCHMR